ncbi:hypothetical protein DPEC_G00263920 [Dallia pectoralis]|uniref:Uncharacterized protein n=1 Tax=Dallia pectoralis TaxID=75939 RepID=A0ACC2FSD7_DALPE|nr:hypothetical protein DPEC_G00263920 [Dallia pectoralis]
MRTVLLRHPHPPFTGRDRGTSTVTGGRAEAVGGPAGRDMNVLSASTTPSADVQCGDRTGEESRKRSPRSLEQFPTMRLHPVLTSRGFWAALGRSPVSQSDPTHVGRTHKRDNGRRRSVRPFF